MRRRNEKSYFPLCLLLLLVLPQVLLPSWAKSFSQQEEGEEERNPERNGNEWRMLCEDAREVCDECKNVEPECLKVESCRRQGVEEEKEDEPSSKACAGVQVNNTAINNLCAYCAQNAEKCENLPICEENGGGIRFSIWSRPSTTPPSTTPRPPCRRKGEPCDDNYPCCRSLECVISYEHGREQQTCESEDRRCPFPPRPLCRSQIGEPDIPCGCYHPGTPVNRPEDNDWKL